MGLLSLGFQTDLLVRMSVVRSTPSQAGKPRGCQQPEKSQEPEWHLPMKVGTGTRARVATNEYMES